MHNTFFKLIPKKMSSYVTRNADSIPLFNTKHNFYNVFVFPSTITEWNNLDSNLLNSENFFILKRNILKFIRPISSSF